MTFEGILKKLRVLGGGDLPDWSDWSDWLWGDGDRLGLVGSKAVFCVDLKGKHKFGKFSYSFLGLHK